MPTIAAVIAMTRLIKDMANPPSKPSIPTASGMKIIITAKRAIINEITAFIFGGLLLKGTPDNRGLL